MTENTIYQPESNKLNRDGKRRIISVSVYFGLEMLILFTAAGRLNWTAAWVYLGLRFVAFLASGLWMMRINPQLINERGRKNAAKTKSWDKIFTAVYLLMLFITPLVAGLDAGRFSWSTTTLVWQVTGLIILIPAMLLPYWAMAVNPFLVTTVRLQEERGQYVVNSGPYQFVRHPMYTGMILMSIASPLLLGSWWMFLPTGITSIAVIVRTALEDRTLQAELPGYTEFTKQTRYRLLPGIW